MILNENRRIARSALNDGNAEAGAKSIRPSAPARAAASARRTAAHRPR
jgi:hypothetical protein